MHNCIDYCIDYCIYITVQITIWITVGIDQCMNNCKDNCIEYCKDCCMYNCMRPITVHITIPNREEERPLQVRYHKRVTFTQPKPSNLRSHSTWHVQWSARVFVRFPPGSGKWKIWAKPRVYGPDGQETMAKIGRPW